MPEEIERLAVAIEANIDPLLKGIREGTDAAEKELGDFGKTSKKSLSDVNDELKRLGITWDENVKRFRKDGRFIKPEGLKELKKTIPEIGDHFRDTTGKARGFRIGITALAASAGAFIAVFATQALSRIVGFFTKIGGAAIQANAQFEVFTSQFETLLGSADAAKQRLDELAQFGVETPFELPEVVQASRVLEVFGGSVLSTGENLRMIGDIAAGVNQPFADVAMWIGRMYDAMASGRPFGEAAMRLQEMGALSGQARAELEKLQKAGASGEELWTAFNEQVGSKFAGNMERLSQTFQGVTSNLVDFRDNLIRIGGERLFESIRDDAQGLLDVLDDPEMRDSLERMARAFGEAATQAKELISSGLFDKLSPEFVDKLASTAENLAQISLALKQIEIPDFSLDLGIEQGSLTDKILRFGPAGIIGEAFESAPDLTETIMQLDTIIKAEDARFKAQLRGKDGQAAYNAVIEEGNKKLEEYQRASQEIAEIIDEGVTTTEKAKDAEAARLQGLADLYAKQEEGVEVEEKINEQLEKSRELLENMTDEFMDLTEERNERIAELEEEHKAEVIKLEVDYINERLKLGHELAEDLADLEEETAKKRADVIEDTRQQLVDLEADTDRSIEEERDQFQRDELRETEDHLRAIRDLRNRYLMDIEDAVKNRDARALVDAQRRFREESQQREQEFNIDQRRDREDQDLRLQQIRENEQRRAAEIIQQQEQALQQLAEHEREQRQKIQEGFQEEMVDLDAEHAEKMLKENQQFAERQTQLEEMLTKRLESVAKELAKEKELNEEGAQAVLETLNEVFGIGGDIDKLMEDFAKRRAQQLVVDVEVRRQFGESVPAGTPRVSSTRPTSTPQRIPAFQHGGSLLATKPTLAQFGEVPELVTFTPLTRINRQERTENHRFQVDVNLSGVPPGMDQAGLENAISRVMSRALREAGAMIRQSGR